MAAIVKSLGAGTMLAQLVVAFALSSTPPSHAAGEAERAISEALKELPDTSARPYWLSVINTFGDKERVAVAFGMTDNLAYCRILTEAYRAQFPSLQPFCEPLE